MENGVTVRKMDLEVWSMERVGSMNRKIFTARLHTLHVWIVYLLVEILN